MNAADPHDLQRFVTAHSGAYGTALGELRRGDKESHWIWYIFPQVVGLGFSPTSEFYAICSRDEALAYLKHALLGPRLRECAQTLMGVTGRHINAIMGSPDNLKLRSSMTLFAAVAPEDPVFRAVLDKHFEGQADGRTLAFLAGRERG